MRQIEKQMVEAIKARKNFKRCNTEVTMTRNEHLGTCTAMVYFVRQSHCEDFIRTRER